MNIASTIVAVTAAAVAAVALSGPWVAPVRGLSLDSLVWLRHATFGPQHPREESPTAVIAIDEETYRREPFQSTPKVMWTSEFAQVLDAVVDGGATAVGIDVILPTSVSSRIRGFDRVFLQSLRRHSREGRVVLSKVQHSLQPILPAIGQRFAVGHGKNIRATNLYTDNEGVVRGAPVSFALSGQDGARRHEPSLSLELAQRALGDRLSFDDAGYASRDGEALPTLGGNNMLINFDDSQRGIPTYSFADMQACAEAGRTDFFQRHFAGKIVLIGAVLDIEDRKLTSLRYTTAADSEAFGDRCAHQPLPGLLSDTHARDTLPGVYVHAFAVNNLIRGNFLADGGILMTAGATFLVAAIVALAAIWLAAPVAGAIAVVTWLIWAGLSVAVFEGGLLLPLFEPPIAAAIAFALVTAYRFTIADRDKRMLRQMFGLYLAPSVIEQMVARSEMPALGGETRDLTVYFSDLKGFTSLSEGMTPDALVKLLNDYLSAMTDIIEAHGGFVDKYIGDAIVAIFGAPQQDTDHANNAVTAALECQRQLAALNDELGLTGENRLEQRIGINTGNILVGNIGSRRRFNYTVMGDAVNLAARLEGANKVYGTHILVSGATREKCRGPIAFREIDRVRVVGREEPVDLFTPSPDTDTPDTGETYAQALLAYRQGDFALAAETWHKLADRDAPSARMEPRARAWSVEPPTNWDGVHNLDAK